MGSKPSTSKKNELCVARPITGFVDIALADSHLGASDLFTSFNSSVQTKRQPTINISQITGVGMRTSSFSSGSTYSSCLSWMSEETATEVVDQPVGLFEPEAMSLTSNPADELPGYLFATEDVLEKGFATAKHFRELRHQHSNEAKPCFKAVVNME
eukprot:Sspe_Gene.24045::Locus_9452_Transcript_2_2_Confidence_0.750_Length_985::g.24045::m.24045